MQIYHEALYEGKLIKEIEVFRNSDPTKYRGKLFCAECKTAQIYIKKIGREKVLVDSPKAKHAEGCSCNLRAATPRQAKLIFNEYPKIRSVLIDNLEVRDAGQVRFYQPFELEYQKGSKTVKSQVGVELVDIEHIGSNDYSMEKIYHGQARCKLVESEDKIYLKLYAPKSEYLYVTISLSKELYNHFPKSVKANFVRIKPVKFMFFGKVNLDKRKHKVSRLRNTDFLVIK